MTKEPVVDVVINVKGVPFISATESKLANVWYREKGDQLFCLTAEGFEMIKGSKKDLESKNLL